MGTKQSDIIQLILEINCAIKLTVLLQERMFPEIDTGAIS
jgi:hypothetical protein|tara:strand:- start:2365 stop:2484 length:120 start_codon:yes stop_codon:yes gene_type:complete